MGSAAGAIAGGVMTVGGGLLGMGGADKAGKAAQGAAMDRQAAAQRYFGESAERLDTNFKDFKDASIADMARMDDIIARQDKNLARQEQMIAQIDPTVLEASQQALKLLRGESSSTLAPIQNQRATERQKLVNQLRAQLGPGAETSTAGIQALTRFDAQTSQLMSSAQQGALAQLGATAGQFNSIRPNLSNEYGMQANLSGRKLGSQEGIMNANFRSAEQRRQDYANVIGSAGAQHTAGLMQGQYQQGLGNQIMGMGMGMLGGSMGGGGGGGSSGGGGGGGGMMAGQSYSNFGGMA